MSINVSKTDESIHILNVLTDYLNTYFNSLVELVNYSVDPLTVGNLNQMTFEYGIVLINSYLDEYNKHFNLSLNDSDRNRIAPYYKRIKKEIKCFCDIKDYRNNVSAHNLRVDNQNIYIHGSFRDYRIPQNIIEFRYLLDCLTLLTNIINRLFPSANDRVQEAVHIRQKNDSTPYIIAKTKEEVDKLIYDLAGDLENIASAQSNK
ncbi:hypothetical protein [Pedobacter panaciterrae]